MQTVSIDIVREPTKSYTLGLYCAFSSACLFLVYLFQLALLVHDRSPGNTSRVYTIQTALYASQLVTLIGATLASVCLPRRPDVFYDGHPVDKMNTQSALDKFSFTWVESMLMLAKQNKHLDLTDLPKMDHNTRAKDLSESWTTKQTSRKLWIEVVLAHKNALILQWVLTMIQAVGTFAPQFVTYFLLRILENRMIGTRAPPEAWIWVVVLTVTSIALSWIESWMYWVSWSQLAIPVRAQLSALIFRKAMRRKDVKGASKDAIKANMETENQSDENSPFVDEENDDDQEDETSGPKSKQSTVNLIGVDAKRISEFCSFNNLFPGSILELIVSFIFMWSIMGWQSMLAGFVSMALTIPINIWSSKRYSNAQDRLMKARDVKMAVVTEALQGNTNQSVLLSLTMKTNLGSGIRQIKFSALEKNWFQKIGKFRAKELDEQWSVFL